jgi:hypothetical protein
MSSVRGGVDGARLAGAYVYRVAADNYALTRRARCCIRCIWAVPMRGQPTAARLRFRLFAVVSATGRCTLVNGRGGARVQASAPPRMEQSSSTWPTVTSLLVWTNLSSRCNPTPVRTSAAPLATADLSAHAGLAPPGTSSELSASISPHARYRHQCDTMRGRACEALRCRARPALRLLRRRGGIER